MALNGWGIASGQSRRDQIVALTGAQEEVALLCAIRRAQDWQERLLAKSAARLADIAAATEATADAMKRLLKLVDRRDREMRGDGNPIPMNGLSARARKACRREDIEDLRELADRTAESMLEVKGCGAGTVAELRAALARHGLKFSGE